MENITIIEPKSAVSTQLGKSGERLSVDFISDFIKEDLDKKRFDHVHTRFPPEPNGWLHIGHLKAISIDFSMAEKFCGKCNLRFDDTNPEKEDVAYVEAIKKDIAWMGFKWDNEFYASDYYDYLYNLAIKIIKKGHAYVDDLNEEEMRQYRGTAVPDKNNITITPPGKNSPHRDRSVEENLDLFAKMRDGKFADGEKTLRAKIDMAHPNLVMRDPVMYRIRRDTHYRTGDKWCIYPMYDFQHPLSDAKEGITHSLCSLEYEIHRPLYDWFIKEAEVFPSRQIEFARLNISKTVLSKRYLLQLVKENYVSGWDDPRMPTIAGLRRRGYTAEALRDFVSRVGIAKTDSMVDIALLEFCLRENLNKRALRAMAVLNPLKLIIENWSDKMEDDRTEEMDAVNNPEDQSAGMRKITFSKELWIEREDFQEVPPPKYYRLYPGNSVRLRYGYIVQCSGFDKDANGNVTAVRCIYDPATKGGNAPDNRKVKSTIHWVSAKTSVPLEVRVYDYLFEPERPMDVQPGKTFLDNLNHNSLQIISGALGEKSLQDAGLGVQYQFERQGYFVRDSDIGTDGKIVFNKTIGLRDTWAKLAKQSCSYS
ncbi:MAG: glutamine--tRNA ligase/YqeY domain fusion protein [Termitinemataceae bacterium]|nr:MAG: glutamine--tRNA ligase/YqeY domain fusion protein [Termitinemataceae bacterium]